MEPFVKIPKAKDTKSEGYKPSRFNIQATDDDGSLFISNTYSGAFLSIPESRAAETKELLKRGTNAIEKDLEQVLVKNGFIVGNDVNELFRARMMHEIVGRKTDTLQLIFLTSEQCNFRCIYCYEKFEKGNMSPEVRDAVKKYVRRQARYLKHFNVHWFGGEPLIAFDVIRDLSKEFIEIAEEFNIQYSSSMTTNGYLLTEDVAKELLSLKVEAFQITLDGDADNHDRHRFLKGGQPTFQRIWNNVKTLKTLDENFRCRIRVNFDKENLPSIPNFIPKLAAEFSNDDRFKVDFFPVGQWGGPNDQDLKTLNERDAYAASYSLCDMNVDAGLHNVLDGALRPGGSVCYAAKPYSFVIGSDGLVYKCTVALYNDKNIVGKLLPDGTMKLDFDKMALWIMNDESEDTGCQSCFFRPACQGASCPLIRIESGEAPCPPVKKNIRKVMKLVGKELKLKKSKKALESKPV